MNQKMTIQDIIIIVVLATLDATAIVLLITNPPSNEFEVFAYVAILIVINLMGLSAVMRGGVTL